MSDAESRDDPLLVEVSDGIVTATLNRPHRSNALDGDLRERMANCFAEADADPAVRVLVLTGNGKAFCAGTDLKSAASTPGGELLNGDRPMSAPLEAFSKPVIVAVNGAAVGGGLELVLAADIKIASSSARFGLSEARIGSMPGSGGTQRLPLSVPMATAMKMLMTGCLIDAAEALRVGLVSDVVEPDQLAHVAQSIAAEVAKSAPLSLAAIKRAVRDGAPGQALSAGMGLERSLWAMLSKTEDRDEGRRAFREGRQPRFCGR